MGEIYCPLTVCCLLFAVCCLLSVYCLLYCPSAESKIGECREGKLDEAILGSRRRGEGMADLGCLFNFLGVF